MLSLPAGFPASMLKLPSLNGRLPRRKARVLAVVLAVLVAALAAWCLTASPPPIKVAKKGGYTDVKLYHDMAAQVAKGENYYPAAATLHRAHHYPLKPFMTMRQPTEVVFAATFGWKAALAVLLNASAATWVLRKHLQPAAGDADATARDRVPLPVVAVHLGLLAGVVLSAHHPVVFLGLFLMFLGFTQAYERHQSPLIIKEALLVGFFLAGLVVLGGMQQWWLQPIVSALAPLALFLGALGLTAITDNAALTYLGSLIVGISDASKYMLVAGAVAGGGLTVIANAPNPAGVALLKRGFADETIGAGGLLLGALGPTAVAAAAFLFL